MVPGEMGDNGLVTVSKSSLACFVGLPPWIRDADDDRERLKYERGGSEDAIEISDGAGSPSMTGDIGKGGKSSRNSSSTLIDRGGGRSTFASKS